MKRILTMLAAAIAASAAGLLPFRSTDVAKLLPVQTVLLLRQEDGVLLKGDDGLLGRGEDCAAALENLRQTAAGDVFLQTATCIVAQDAALLDAAAETGALRPAAAVYLTQDLTAEPTALGKCLRSHGADLTLGLLQAADARGEAVRIPTVRRSGSGWEVVDG